MLLSSVFSVKAQKEGIQRNFVYFIAFYFFFFFLSHAFADFSIPA
jgi:hypothetical protein